MGHGAYAGAADDLPSTGVTKILEVRQLDTVYVPGADYAKKGDQVDWSPAGAEPSPGSTYQVVYQHISDVQPEHQDLDGFSVSGAVPGTQIMYGYTQMLPRYDRLALDSDGNFTWFKGIASETSPQRPTVPSTLLALTTVYQSWRPDRKLTNDGVRVVPYDDIAAMNTRIDYVVQEIARQRLEADVSTREAGARVGMFVDPLTDDSMDASFAFSSTVKNSKELTSAILAHNANYMAAKFCRAVSLADGFGAMDLPSIDVLMRIYQARTVIDSLDSTATANAAKKLTAWGFGSAGGAYVWSASEYSSNGAWNVSSGGSLGSNAKSLRVGCVPALEIPA